MDKQFQLSLPGTRPLLDGAEVKAPAQFYERKVFGSSVYGLWIGGERIFGVAISDPANRPIGSIGPDSPEVSDAYDRLQRALVAEALLAGPISPALAAERAS